MLFEKKQGNQILLQPHGVIPLSKSCVAVPLCSKLYVDVALNVNAMDLRVSMSFDAHTKGVFAQPTQPSNDSKIQVIVTWDDDEDGILANYDGPLNLANAMDVESGLLLSPLAP